MTHVSAELAARPARRGGSPPAAGSRLLFPSHQDAGIAAAAPPTPPRRVRRGPHPPHGARTLDGGGPRLRPRRGAQPRSTPRRSTTSARSPAARSTSRRPSRHTLPGIGAHYVRALHAQDITTVDAIPVTSLARTYLDLAEILSSRPPHRRPRGRPAPEQAGRRRDPRRHRPQPWPPRDRAADGRRRPAHRRAAAASVRARAGLPGTSSAPTTFPCRSSTPTSRASSWTWCGRSTG